MVSALGQGVEGLNYKIYEYFASTANSITLISSTKDYIIVFSSAYHFE